MHGISKTNETVNIYDKFLPDIWQTNDPAGLNCLRQCTFIIPAGTIIQAQF